MGPGINVHAVGVYGGASPLCFASLPGVPGTNMLKANRRFLLALIGVAAIVIYLTWTGVTDTMVYYLTPVELVERVGADPSFQGVGVKMGGKVVEGSYERIDGELLHSFMVADLVDPAASFSVEYADAIPDTFSEDVEVVVEGFLREDGVFEAHTLLTKCGSRFEAAPGDLLSPAADDLRYGESDQSAPGGIGKADPPPYGGSRQLVSPEGVSE